ncbi:hypothetical protein [Spirosoma agri]|uniref:Uncharacterized protein n=1 Tax=Spirosoma agri TaxID=1987381 RepID=A0A6M0IRH8_9BACT|nr:hypothetical protein [Spirosoma agri]NEU69553.1 hypothetical protein [Spirosoma agri]
MNTYNVTSTERRVFTLTRNDSFVGRLVYDKWFSFQSTIELPGYAPFTVDAKGFDWSNVTVNQNAEVVADFKLTWNGQFVIKTRLDTIADQFLVKQKGVVNNKFVLLTNDGVELLVVEPTYTGTQSTVDYRLSASDAFDEVANRDLLGLVVIHCANYYVAMMAMSTATLLMV